MPAPWPPVSAIMPVKDEERHLEAAVRSVLSQYYPGELELVLAVAPSSDATALIAARLAAEDPRIRVVDNPRGWIPSGLNAAWRAARHSVVVRVDGHSELTDGYIRRAVSILTETGADNVGGVMAAEGESDFQRAVARAYTSRIGLGGGAFHVGGPAGPVQSVYLGVFRKEALERVGGYDERLMRAEDWELNHRIRESGGTVWFDPTLRVIYRPRRTLGALARQYYTTGQWRREVVRLHPGTADARYLAPPLAVLAVAGGTAAGVAARVLGRRELRLGWLAPAGYLTGLAAGSYVEGRDLPVRARAWLPAALLVMHGSWGAGFLVGARRQLQRCSSSA